MTLQQIVADLKFYNYKAETGSTLERSKAFQELEKRANQEAYLSSLTCQIEWRVERLCAEDIAE